MDNEVSNTFYEVQAEKFYQKKVEVARGVIELGQILRETKDKLPHGSWINWLKDSRVNFTERQAQKYMKIARELGDTNHRFIFDQLSMSKLYTLVLAPEEVKEDVANSKDKEEAKKKIKDYEEQLKQEKLAREALIDSNQQLQEQLEKEKAERKIKEYEPQQAKESSNSPKKERVNPTRRQMNEVMARAKGICERCGLNLVEYHMCKEFHHIDGDCSNTVVDNLQLLCANCHKIIQYELDNK